MYPGHPERGSVGGNKSKIRIEESNIWEMFAVGKEKISYLYWGRRERCVEGEREGNDWGEMRWRLGEKKGRQEGIWKEGRKTRAVGE